MTSASLIEVVQDAVDLTGMTDVQVEDRTRLLSDNGSGYVSRLFREGSVRTQRRGQNSIVPY